MPEVRESSFATDLNGNVKKIVFFPPVRQRIRALLLVF